MRNAAQYRRIKALHGLIKREGCFSLEMYEEYPHDELIRDLAEVKWRTIERDFDRMKEEFNAPLMRENNRYWYTNPTFELPMLVLTDNEVVDVILGQVLLERFRGTDWYGTVAFLAEKLRAATDGTSAMVSAEVFSSFDVSYIPEIDKAVFDQVLACIVHKQKLSCVYTSFSSGNHRRRLLHPYHLFTFGGQWYMAAWCEDSSMVKDFSLGRMAEVGVTVESFEVNAQFDLQRYLHGHALGIEKGGAPQLVRLKFSNDQAKYMQERVWHESQTWQADGEGVILSMTVSVTDELVRWILSYGPEVTVLSPDALRQKVQTQLAQTLERYQ